MLRYITLLSNFVAQFARIGNNYNQIVKAVNTRLSRNSLPAQIEILIDYTSQLKNLSEDVLKLTEQLRKEWLRE